MVNVIKLNLVLNNEMLLGVFVITLYYSFCGNGVPIGSQDLPTCGLQPPYPGY